MICKPHEKQTPQPSSYQYLLIPYDAAWLERVARSVDEWILSPGIIVFNKFYICVFAILQCSFLYAN